VHPDDDAEEKRIRMQDRDVCLNTDAGREGIKVQDRNVCLSKR